MGFQVSYLLILACILSGSSAVIITSEETVYASAGSNVTLKCSIFQGNKTHITQIQWSKLADSLSRIIAVYNPHYGTKYFEVAYNNSASFEKGFHDCWSDFRRTSKEVNSITNNLECSQWVLKLKNVTLELSGSYECIFTTFPVGTSSSKIHLIVKTRDYKNTVLHALLNQTLEIPCLSSTLHHINLANASITWLLQKENGSEEILIRKQSYYLQDHTAYLTVYKDRIQMSSKNALLISPVTVTDDGKKFVCSIANLPGRIQESAIQVKVFEKPEISIVLHADSIGKANFTCVIKKAYPEPKLMWYMGEEILDEKSEGLLIENKGIKRTRSFYERTSFLSIWNTTHSSINQAFKCMSVYHFTRSERWNISSKEIIIPHEFQTTLLEYSEFINHVTAVSYSPTERLQTTLSEVSEVSLASDSPSERNLSTRRVTELTTQSRPSNPYTVKNGLNTGLESSRITIPPNAVTATHLQENSVPSSQRNLSTRRVAELTTKRTPTNPYTVKNDLNTGNLSTRRVAELTPQRRPTNPYTVKNGLNTGSTVVPKQSTFPWPGVVALLLLFCTFLIFCGVRKWCQHQRKIMNKPPSFKPPPPPVKYASIQVYNEIYPSCDELENMV